MWDAANGAEALNLVSARQRRGIVQSVKFSPDGKCIASASSGDNAIKICDSVTGMELLNLWCHGVYSLVFSPDGKRLVAGCSDGTAKIWDTSTGDELLTLPADQIVSCIAFSPDGESIAGGTFGKTVVLWESAALADD